MTSDAASFRESYRQLLREVLELQRAILSGGSVEGDPELYYSAVDRYCEEVDRLLNLIIDPFFSSDITEDEQTACTEVLVNHESITAKLQTELSNVGQQRADLQKKTKGISSYIDKLPKRISTVRTKKG